MPPTTRALYRALQSLCKQVDNKPWLRLLGSSELASLRGCRPAVYCDRSASGLPSGFAKMPDRSTGIGKVPDSAYELCRAMNLCCQRDSRYGCFPCTSPQATLVPFTPVCRALFRSEATSVHEVEEYKSFGFTMLNELSMMLSWADQFMGSSSGFVVPPEKQQRKQCPVNERATNKPLGEALKLCTQGEMAALSGDWNKAYRCFEASARRCVTAESLAALAWLHTHPSGQGQQHALELLDDALIIDPTHGRALFEKATILSRQGHFDTAAGAFDMSKRAPYDKVASQRVGRADYLPEAYLQHGQMLCERGYTDGAMAQYLMAAHLKMDQKVLKIVLELWEMRKTMLRRGSKTQAQTQKVPDGVQYILTC